MQAPDRVRDQMENPGPTSMPLTVRKPPPTPWRWVLALAGIVGMGALQLTPAQDVPWRFDPPKIGRVLQQGGWSVAYEVGEITASPEFTFPLQLVYLNGREETGFFGERWFCPQLDSRVVPRGNGTFVWQMPSGGMMGFRQDPKDKRDFRSFSGDWMAKVNGQKQEIWNNEGWRFFYERSRLTGVTSPSGRSLIFIWKGKRLQEVRVGGKASDSTINPPLMIVLRIAYAEADDRIAGLEVHGRVSRFEYAKGKDGALAMWTPPAGARRGFGYTLKGLLAWTQLEKGIREDFRTEFTVSGTGAKADRANPANWWLIQDRDFTYTYGVNTAGHSVPTQITATDRAGQTRTADYTENRGMLVETVSTGGERKTYFYRAPGQRYDGKLRQIVENGKVLAEYRYDRKSGLLTESIDQDGLITFYDYPPGVRKGKFVAGKKGAAAHLGKPILVRQGTRKQRCSIG